MPESRPHHSWMTKTPGPDPSGGVTKYPDATLPLLWNSTISAMAHFKPMACPARYSARLLPQLGPSSLSSPDLVGLAQLERGFSLTAHAWAGSVGANEADVAPVGNHP